MCSIYIYIAVDIHMLWCAHLSSQTELSYPKMLMVFCHYLSTHLDLKSSPNSDVISFVCLHFVGFNLNCRVLVYASCLCLFPILFHSDIHKTKGRQ